jgi:hypothetical protein
LGTISEKKKNITILLIMYFETIKHLSQEKIVELSANAVTYLVFLAEGSASEAEEIIATLNQNGINFFGAIYPTIFQDNINFESGFLIIPAKGVKKVIKVKNNADSLREQVGDLSQYKTAFLLIDGLMENKDDLFREIYSVVGTSVNIVGGGAGYFTLQQNPCLFTNEGIFMDGALLALIENKSQVAVKHGWDMFAGPFMVTSSENNVIHEINWQSAFEVYKNAIESDSEHRFNDTNYFDIAKMFPIGIHKDGKDFVVRDPYILRSNGHIECISDIPENSMIYILKGDQDTLINAAEEVSVATNDAERDCKCLMVFDCITRVKYLDDRFKEELDMMKFANKEVPPTVYGVSTLGEIASTGYGYVEFYNKTIVAAAIY